MSRRTNDILTDIRVALDDFMRENAADFQGKILMHPQDYDEFCREVQPWNAPRTGDPLTIFGYEVYVHTKREVELHALVRRHEMDTPNGRVSIDKRQDNNRVVSVSGPEGTHFDGELTTAVTHVTPHRAVRKRRRMWSR